MIYVFRTEWDVENKRWKTHKGNISSNIRNLIKKVLGMPIYAKQQPNKHRLLRFINENIVVSTDPNTRITTLSIQTNDIIMGKFLLEQIHLTADNILRLKKKVRTDENLKFLFDQLNKTTSMDLRETIIENISEQRKTKMLVETNLSFVAEPFGSVYSSERPTNPNPR